MTLYIEQNYPDCDLEREIFSRVNMQSGSFKSRNWVGCDVIMTEQ